MGLLDPNSGSVNYKGTKVYRRIQNRLKGAMQMVFQDPYGSVDPRMKIHRIVEEPLRIHTQLTEKEQYEKSRVILENLGLNEIDMVKFPHEFSGGQLQRIGIARAFITDPEFVVCDEPVSALDMSIQAQIINLFMQLQRERGVTYLFVSHDMNVIKHVSSRIAVLYMGHLVELAEKKDFFNNTLHPYSQALISAIPVPNPGHKRTRVHLAGELPNPLNLPPGCPFQTRCSKAQGICKEKMPALADAGNGHFVACYFHNN
jgi:oligopeptide/dipeptide ABC transporter ATP-binding protein